MRKSHGHGAKRVKSLAVGKSPAGQSPRDRLLSAKQHAVKDLQSKLGATVQICDDLKKENKLLRTLQARQEKELEKYQNQEGELPQILIQHSEEVRMLKEQLKRSQASLAMHQNQLKDTQQKLLQTSERNKKLEALVKKKGLLEREMLTYQLQEAQLTIADKDRRISVSYPTLAQFLCKCISDYGVNEYENFITVQYIVLLRKYSPLSHSDFLLNGAVYIALKCSRLWMLPCVFCRIWRNQLI